MTLHIMDGSNYLFRAYFALMHGRGGQKNTPLSNSRGMPTGALHVFTGMLLKILLEDRPEHFVVVFDAEGRSFRSAIDPAYKANRTAPPDDLVPQFPYFERIVRAFELPVIRVPEVEADDVIATLATRCSADDHDVVIYSGDKDLMAILDDHVRLTDGMRDITYDAAAVEKKLGVPPSQVRDFLALKGDSIDNVPGVKGVGDKTAAKLLGEYGDIDGILAAAAGIKGKLGQTLQDPEQQDRLRRSRELVTLKFDVNVDCDLGAYRRREWSMDALMPLFRELEFQRFIDRLVELGPAAAGGEGDGRATGSDSGIDRDEFRVVDTQALLSTFRQELAGAPRLSFTTITRDPDDPRSPVVGFAAAAPDVAAAYIPCGHVYLGDKKQLDAAHVMKALAPLLSDDERPKVVYDLKREWLCCARFGVELAGVTSDVLVAAYLLDPSRSAYTLEALGSLVGHQAIPAVSLTGTGKKRQLLDGLEIGAVAPWAAEQAALVLPLADTLDAQLDAADLGEIYRDMELPLARVLGVMEQHGIRVDGPELEKLGARLGKTCAGLEAKIHDIAGYPVNVGSPKQLQELLYQRLGLEPARKRKTKTGYSMDHRQLTEMRDLHPVVAMILEHRELTKLKSTYLDALPPLIDADTGRIHTSYSQTQASTGRLASNNPNIQNIPIRTDVGKLIRRAFVAEEGMLLLSLDYSQIELRVLAHLSGDPVLREAFQRDVDVHAWTAAEVFDVEVDTVDAEQRRVAKAVNYGLGYGQTDFGLAQALDIPRAQAKKYIERYFERFSGVARHMEEVIEKARAEGSVRTISGRRLPLPAIHSRNFQERTGAERLARNAPIQGTAADILKIAMLRIQAELDAMKGKDVPRMLLTVHDELVFEVPREQSGDFARRVQGLMENAVSLDVPLKVDVGEGRSWADAH